MSSQKTDYDSTADDLFAGAGGWDLAAQQLSIHARGIEIMPEACETREAAGLTTIHDDVWTYVPDGKAAGLIASPPCQTFSAAGKGSGRKALDDVLSLVGAEFMNNLDHLREFGQALGDERTALVLTPLHFALTGGYRWLAWEQVPTVLPVWEACAEVLREHGWNVWTGLLHAEQYGVPQTRKRAFLLASLNGPVQPPTPTHSRYYSRNPGQLDLGVDKWVSMAEALGWGLRERPSPTVTGGGTETGGAEPIAKLYTSRPDWVLRNNSSANAAERSPRQPSPTLYFGQRSNYCAWEWRGEGPMPEQPEWPFERPAPTVVGSRRSSGGMLIGRQLGDDSRADVGGHQTSKGLRSGQLAGVRVTVGEAGVLQSFPADHPWQGKQGKQFLQCGNAVPPRLALHALSAASGIAIGRQEAVA